MLCFISFIFIFLIVGQYESGSITDVQALIYGLYGSLMLYYTSKPYWTENQKNRRK